MPAFGCERAFSLKLGFFDTPHLYPRPKAGTFHTEQLKVDGRVGLAKDELNPGQWQKPTNILGSLACTL